MISVCENDYDIDCDRACADNVVVLDTSKVIVPTDDDWELLPPPKVTKPYGQIQCRLCNDTQQVVNGLGMVMQCDCVQAEVLEKHRVEHDPNHNVSDDAQQGQVEPDARVMAVSEDLLGLIPELRKDDEYDPNILDAKVAQLEALGHKVSGLEEYQALLSTIYNASLRTDHRLTSSYLICAPKSFGKTTFAHECLKNLNRRGLNPVPYTSLIELHRILEYDFFMQKKYADAIKAQVRRLSPDDEEKNRLDMELMNRVFSIDTRYLWTQYVNTELVFLELSGDASWSKLEIPALQVILKERGKRGLATVVFVDSFVDKYISEPDYRFTFWAQHFSSKGLASGTGKLSYIRCYISYKK